jgi:diguanylate cyclase (GGDEF)-like protein/putative nucleotidyltransferase with HDIG domain
VLAQDEEAIGVSQFEAFSDVHGAGSTAPFVDAPRGAPGAETEPRERKGLPRSALVYLFLVVGATAGTSIPLVQGLSLGTRGWLTFFALAGCAAAAQLFNVRTPRDRSFHTTSVFLLPAALVLPLEFLPLLVIIQHIPEWLKQRYPWYIQSFNIANYTLALLAAAGCARGVLATDAFVADARLQLALAGLAAVIAFVVVVTLNLAVMLHLGRGHRLRDMFSFESLSTEFVLAALGVAVGIFWQTNPWLIPFALAPLVVIHRSLAVPQLQAEARVDPKTGLFNARHFANALAEEIGRAVRFNRPLSLIMADLDLLRDINNSYGHLAGDAVLQGIAEIFRQQLRHYDIPARFGGEEFSILLPETSAEQALEIAERIRRAVADHQFEVETSSDPIRATVSIGIAGFPKDATDANELIHQADLAVYRAKLQGRNRVLGASAEPLLLPAERSAPLVTVVPEDGEHREPLPRAPEAKPPLERRNHPRPHALHGPRFLALSRRLATLVGLVSLAGGTAGVLGMVYGTSTDWIGLIAVVALVGASQALTLSFGDGSISVAAVGALAGAALFGPRAALALALATVVVEWSARRTPMHTWFFNIGALSLASLAAAGTFWLGAGGKFVAAAGLLAGGVYFAVNMGLLSVALAMEGHERWWSIFRERFAWLLPHYVVYGFIGGVIAIGYEAAGLYALAVFAVPLLLMRKTQEAYIAHTQKSTQKLRVAAETIQSQNVSLEQANRLLKERSTAAMESLSATVDARDSYTAGHSRRVQQLALAIGRELGLSQAELDLLGHAALFHDIGKLAIPDSILLKPASLTSEEWALMQRHADEGARIIDRLGFLGDAVPAIRHHHERWDGTGYPDRLTGEEIPLGARIIHVADALDSMLTTRIYRAARPAYEALTELRRAADSQFCPRTVAALERILPLDGLQERDLNAPAERAARLAAAS